MDYAVIENGYVVNTIAWDGEAPWAPPEGSQLAEITEGTACSIGYSATQDEGGAWTFTPPPVPPPSPEEVLATNTAMRNSYLDAAARAIAPLQDAVDLGIASAQEQTLLTAWKQFRVAVNRIDLTAASPEWPSSPAPLSYAVGSVTA
ncbi:tail fiber assembly protein [Luteibacter sp. NPDC031894]|uniref:tail fiber assembly protein n=1 Tax=Luteibacter sp. NPDC031894 TaxID=3390572 RepID=UPI003D06AA87